MRSCAAWVAEEKSTPAIARAGPSGNISGSMPLSMSAGDTVGELVALLVEPRAAQTACSAGCPPSSAPAAGQQARALRPQWPDTPRRRRAALHSSRGRRRPDAERPEAAPAGGRARWADRPDRRRRLTRVSPPGSRSPGGERDRRRQRHAHPVCRGCMTIVLRSTTLSSLTRLPQRRKVPCRAPDTTVGNRLHHRRDIPPGLAGSQLALSAARATTERPGPPTFCCCAFEMVSRRDGGTNLKSRRCCSAYRKTPHFAGPFLSGSISRILSLSSHPSERPTWTSAGNLQAVLFGLASSGVCPAAASPRRWCALTAPFHPCRSAVHVGRPT